MKSRGRTQSYSKKWLEDAMIFDGYVKEIEMQNEPVGENLKNVFYCAPETNPENCMMCIFYNRTTFEIGDKVRLKGRISNGTFIAWSVQILRKKVIE